jgi:hypothetical protein
MLRTKYFDVVKFTILTQLSLRSLGRLSFPFVGLIIFSLPNLALKSNGFTAGFQDDFGCIIFGS